MAVGIEMAVCTKTRRFAENGDRPRIKKGAGFAAESGKVQIASFGSLPRNLRRKSLGSGRPPKKNPTFSKPSKPMVIIYGI